MFYYCTIITIAMPNISYNFFFNKIFQKRAIFICLGKVSAKAGFINFKLYD